MTQPGTRRPGKVLLRWRMEVSARPCPWPSPGQNGRLEDAARPWQGTRPGSHGGGRESGLGCVPSSKHPCSHREGEALPNLPVPTAVLLFPVTQHSSAECLGSLRRGWNEASPLPLKRQLTGGLQGGVRVGPVPALLGHSSPRFPSPSFPHFHSRGWTSRSLGIRLLDSLSLPESPQRPQWAAK